VACTECAYDSAWAWPSLGQCPDLDGIALGCSCLVQDSTRLEASGVNPNPTSKDKVTIIAASTKLPLNSPYRNTFLLLPLDSPSRDTLFARYLEVHSGY
jgi:hypothetical protein